jgi:hypothetical protein
MKGQGVYHHYHLTLNRVGQPTWTYTQVDLSESTFDEDGVRLVFTVLAVRV